MIDSIEPLALAAVALLAGYVIFGLLPKRWLGPDVSIFNPIRRAVLPMLDRTFSEYGGYAETRAREAEYVGTFVGSLDDLEAALYAAGYTRYPLASLASTDDGRTEIASWARHDGLWSDRQTHARVFDAHPEAGETDQSAFDLYAHGEYTAHNPLYAHKHYRGIGLSPEEGVAKVMDDLRGQGVTLTREDDGEDPFEPPMRESEQERMEHVDEMDDEEV